MKNMTPAATAALAVGDIENFMVASTPGGIEKQEAQGQIEFISNCTLPKKMIHGCTKEKLEAMGVKFGEDVDDIFVNVILPEGWGKKATDHSMWSELLDEKGRKRAQIFYKAAFYDRRSHISLSCRFTVEHMPEDQYKTEQSYEDRQNGNWYGVIKDCGKIIFQTDARIGGGDWDSREELITEATTWLREKYPNYEDETAYWD